MENEDTISATEFKRLVAELQEHGARVRIRFRLTNGNWEKNFLQIVHTTTASSVIVQDSRSDQMKFISLKEVAEFEIEQKFQNFRPQRRYKVLTA